MTVSGLLVMLLGNYFQRQGTPIAEGKVESFVEVALLLAGLLIAWYGRYRHGDITWWGRKKSIAPSINVNNL